MTDIHGQERYPSLPWLIAAVFLLLVLLVRTYFNLAWPVNYDCSMYLASGQMMLAGKVPYIDFVDLNPPLIFYLSTVPAWLSKISGLPIDACFTALVWAFGSLCWLLSALLLLRQENGEENVRAYAWPLLLGLASFSLLTGEWGEFGQRQYLLSVAWTAFFICRWLRSLGSLKPNLPIWLTVPTGALFGLTLALVPQYVIIPAACEIYFLLENRRLRNLLSPEIFAAASTVAMAPLSVLMLPPVARDAFLHKWVPLVIKGYGAYNCDWKPLTTFPFIIGCFPLLLSAIWLARKYRSSLTIPLFVWAAAAYLAMLIQLKGWYNHYLPLLAAGCLLASTELAAREFARERKTGRAPSLWSESTKVAATLVVIAVCTAPSIFIRETMHYPQSELTLIEEKTAAGDSVAVLSTSVSDIYPPLLQAGRQNALRYMFLFPIEMFRWLESKCKSTDQRRLFEQQEDLVLTEIKQDIERTKPTLILIPEGKTEEQKKFSMMTYFANKGLLAELEHDYKQIGTCEGRRTFFTAWQRIGERGLTSPNAD